MTANFNPKLNQYRTTQMVDLCRARQQGTVAASESPGATTDTQSICSTFQSLIHGNSQGQVASAAVSTDAAAQETPINPLWMRP